MTKAAATSVSRSSIGRMQYGEFCGVILGAFLGCGNHPDGNQISRRRTSYSAPLAQIAEQLPKAALFTVSMPAFLAVARCPLNSAAMGLESLHPSPGNGY